MKTVKNYGFINITYFCCPIDTSCNFYNLVNEKKLQKQDRLGFSVSILFTATYILFIFNTGRWDWVSYYLGYIVSAVFFLSVFFINHKGTIVSLAHMMKDSLRVKKGDLVKVGHNPLGR